MQALAETSLQLVSQLNEGENSPVRLDSGLQLLVQLQSRHLSSKAKDGSDTCCIEFFIKTQVSKPGWLHDMLQAILLVAPEYTSLRCL